MIKQAFAICKKDFSSEIRTRYAINALLMFIIVVISIIKFSLGEEKLSSEMNAGILWIIIFFAASNGLSRVFVSEEERGTSLAIKLSAEAKSVLLGKLIFNTSLTFIINFFIIFLYIIITDLKISSIGLFLITIILGNFGLSSVMTIIAALISKASSKGTLYPVLSFPLLLPLLLASISATWLSIEGTAFSGISGELQIMVSYTIVVITASFLLFDLIWND
ncbi:MAG: heme exporter protein CcmB [Chlorobi bacterium]|nr:heme exporter protein CcmB [Chlorobiota bacterium]MCI0716676.1 heme exporter protein CcmB [Chlorobiota bacterium]